MPKRTAGVVDSDWGVTVFGEEVFLKRPLAGYSSGIPPVVLSSGQSPQVVSETLEL